MLHAMSRKIEPGTIIKGRYQIKEKLGQGGYGSVWSAFDQDRHYRVAIKILNQALADNTEQRERFFDESRLASSIEHPHILEVYERGTDEGLYFIVMRLIKSDLKLMLSRERQLDLLRALAIADQIAKALDVAYRQRGLIHRDVKPANVLITSRASPEEHDDAYLADFGIAKLEDAERTLTNTGAWEGSVPYAAPEQLDSEEDGRTDQYSLACVIYEMLTGAPPFRGDTRTVLHAHVSAPRPQVSLARPDLPSSLDGVGARGLAIDRNDRFPTCGRFVHTLYQVGRQASRIAGPAVELDPPPPQSASLGDEPSPATVGAAASMPVERSASTTATAATPGGVRPDPPSVPPPSRPPAQNKRSRRRLALIAAALAAAVALAILVWPSGRPPADVLVLIDISSSMDDPLGDPAMPNYTRMEAVRDYAIPRIEALDREGDRIGVWLVTSSDLGLPPQCESRAPCMLIPLTDATRDVRAEIQELISPTSATAPRLRANNGGTPLYRSIRSGVQTLQRDDAPKNAIKSLVVITDGDEDPNTNPHEDDPPTVLPGVFDKNKPVQVLITAAGNELCGEFQTSILDVFGGECYDARTIKAVQAARDDIRTALREDLARP
jgi:serine/threonine-protein kinase